MQIELSDILGRLVDVLERIDRKLSADEPETGTSEDACRLLKIAPRTLQRRMKYWQEGVHYWYEGGKLVFDLPLLKDWQRNRKNPLAHARAIEVRRSQLLSQRKEQS